MALVEGAFVHTLFPTTEKPREPGVPHVCYCLAVMPQLAVVAYTSTQPWPAELPPPPWVRVFDAIHAERLGQRPFVLYLNRIAKLPLTRRWFPEFDAPTHGILAVANLRLRNELLAVAVDVAKRRPEMRRVSGP